VTPDGVQASCRIPPESDWFSGHFPSNPIFPALGMIGLVDRVLADLLPSGEPGGPRGRQYKRIRFRQIVRPGEEIVVAASPEKPGARDRFRFRILKEAEPICEGVALRAGPVPGGGVAADGADAAEVRIAERADAPIESLVPHRGRMRLVDTFEGHDESRDGISRSVVKAGWPLCDGLRVNPHVMIELVAQATAAMAGWDEFKGGKRLGFGYIVGIKNACLCGDTIPVGAVLTMRTRKILAQENYGVFSGEVYLEKRRRAEVLLQVFRPEG